MRLLKKCLTDGLDRVHLSHRCNVHGARLMDYGYLQFGSGNGPVVTLRVSVRMRPPFNWFALYEGKWRKVHVNLSRTWIVYRGEKITINIEGV